MFFLALVFLTMTLRVERKNKTTRKHKNLRHTTLERVRAQSISTNNKLYDACNECTYDACSNVQILVQLFKIYQQLTWIKEF